MINAREKMQRKGIVRDSEGWVGAILNRGGQGKTHRGDS